MLILTLLLTLTLTPQFNKAAKRKGTEYTLLLHSVNIHGAYNLRDPQQTFFATIVRTERITTVVLLVIIIFYSYIQEYTARV